MRKDLGSKPILYPEPVLIIASYDENGVPNAMNAAWGGIHEDHELSICLSPEHKTVKNILKRKAFTVSMATEDFIEACDYVGIVSGNDVPDKFSKAGFTSSKSRNVDAPVINELPMCVECRMLSYNEKNCELIGEIVNVNADESVLTDGRIDPFKMRPVVYDGMNHKYISLGKNIADAFSAGKKLI